MSTVYSLLSARVHNILSKFSYDLDRMWNSTIAAYHIDPKYPHVRRVFELLSDTMTSRYKKCDKLYDESLFAINYEERRHGLGEIRKKLADDPRRVLTSFHNKITKSEVDLHDPRAATAFKAANELLYSFLKLEHDYMRAFLETAQGHLRLHRQRRRQQASQLSHANQDSRQRAESGR
jgi:hypothetical protein